MQVWVGSLRVKTNMTAPNEASLHVVIHKLHSKLRSITPVAAKVHVILISFVVLTWTHDTIE